MIVSTIGVDVNELTESVRNNLTGAVDFHIHCHEAKGYRQNLVEMAEQAIAAGMSAWVIKNLYGTSQEACHAANKKLGITFLYPSLTLGRTTGGMNPAAVDDFFKAAPGNRIVEMPVLDSMHEIRLRNLPKNEGTAIFEDHLPVPGLSEILKMLAERDLVLKTGHIAPSESLQLIRLAREAGVNRIVVTHATGSPVMATPKEQKEMADLGAFIEHCLCKFLPISRLKNIKRFPHWKGPTFGDLDYLKTSLEWVGPDRCIVATDSGQSYNPMPTELFVNFLYLLEELGFSENEIQRMCKDNPRRTLKISDDERPKISSQISSIMGRKEERNENGGLQ